MNTNFRRAKVAKIHIAQNELGMADEVYRALLMRMTNKNSCSKMTDKELELVLAEMVRLGFVVKKSDPTAPPAPRADIAPMVGKVEALLASRQLPWQYAHAMAERMFNVKRVQWLEPRQIHKLIAALQVDANRRAT